MREKHILIMPDSFKGTMTAGEVSQIIGRTIQEKDPQVRITAIPMADGGEGTCDCFLCALGGEIVRRPASGPLFQRKESFYWRKGDTAVVELAAAAGFIEEESERNPEKTTTLGVGELIRSAIEDGARKIVLGLGGSSTNDGGTGMAAALGAGFFDAEGRAFIPTGGSLQRICRIDVTDLCRLTEQVHFDVMCDVDNPLCGPRGAAHVFGPQKGADAAMVKRLDLGLEHLAKLLQRDLGIGVMDLPGGGAAGGAGAGAYAFLGGRLRSGAQIVLEMNRFQEQLDDCDLIITGEGCLDGQSLQGKVVSVIARQAKAAGVPVIAIVGRTGEGWEKAPDLGIGKVVRTNDFCPDPNQYKKSCRQDLAAAVRSLFD